MFNKLFALEKFCYIFKPKFRFLLANHLAMPKGNHLLPNGAMPKGNHLLPNGAMPKGNHLLH